MAHHFTQFAVQTCLPLKPSTRGLLGLGELLFRQGQRCFGGLHEPNRADRSHDVPCICWFCILEVTKTKSRALRPCTSQLWKLQAYWQECWLFFTTANRMWKPEHPPTSLRRQSWISWWHPDQIPLFDLPPLLASHLHLSRALPLALLLWPAFASDWLVEESKCAQFEHLGHSTTQSQCRVLLHFGINE